MIYDIWMEGFAFSMDERAGASFVESIEADSFQEACDKCKLNKIIGDEDPSYKGKNLYDSAQRSYWGMRLFDNEADARKSFG